MKTHLQINLKQIAGNASSQAGNSFFGGGRLLVLAFFLSLMFLPGSKVFSQVLNPSFAGVISDGFANVPSLTNPAAVFVSGNYAYVVNGQGLEIVDITLPGLPRHKGSLANGTGGAKLLGAWSIYVSGNYAYVGSFWSTALEIIDVSNPSSPVHKGSAYAVNPRSVYVSGNYAYVRGGSSFQIIDVTNPAAPVQKGGLSNGQGGALISADNGAVFVSGNFAYLINGEDLVTDSDNSLEIIDITNPTAPVHKGSLINGTGGALLARPHSVFVSGHYAYVASSGSNALEIIDVTDPSAPFHKGSLTNGAGGALLGTPESVHVVGNYAYLACRGSDALEIVDVTDPQVPVHKGSVTNGANGALLDGARFVYVDGSHAYIASGNSNTLEIVDVSAPDAPVHKGSLANGTGGALLRGPWAVHVQGNYAYVASGYSNALEIVDVTEPTSLLHTGSLTLPLHTGIVAGIVGNQTGPGVAFDPRSIYVSGKYAYLTNYVEGALDIVDITQPTTPVYKGSLIHGTGGALLGGPRSVFVSGSYAYVVSSGSNSLEIVDVSNPAAPVHKGSLTDGAGGALLGAPLAIHVSGNLAYVASSGSNALEIVDITNPAAPVHHASLTDGTGGTFLSAPRSVCIVGNYAYLVGQGGMYIVDITDPSNPVRRGSLAQGTFGISLSGSSSISVSENYAYIGPGYAALEVVDVTNPDAPVLKTQLRDSFNSTFLCGSPFVFVSGSYAYLTSFCGDGLVTVNLHTPSITSFSPASGSAGSVVTITGKNFDTFLSAAIGGVPAAITGIKETTLNITIPSGAPIGPITLTSKGSTATSARNFVVTPSALSATNIQQNSFTATWSDVKASALPLGRYLLDVSSDNFNTYVTVFNGANVGQGTSFSVTELNPGTAYQWRVRSTDNFTVSSYSNTVALLTIPATPFANPATAISQTGFTANWDLVANASGYYLDVATDAGFTTMVPGYIGLALSASTTSQVVSGLNSGKFFYRVRSSNVSGTSPSSNEVSVTTYPPTPLAAAASAIATNGFVASWSAVTSTSYSIDISADNFATLVPGFDNQNVGTVTTLNVTGLAPGISYQFRVRANNATGSSGNSNIISLLTLPEAPRALAAGGVLPSQFNASWTRANGANGYYLDIAADSLFSIVVYDNISIGNESSYTVSGLSPASTYYLRLRARNQTGASVNSKYISITTVAAAVTTQSSSLSISSVSENSVTLNFTPGNGTSHLVVVSEGSPLTAVPSNRNSYSVNATYSLGSKIGNGYVVAQGLSPVTVTGLSPATTYYFQVFDFNGSGGTENYNTAIAINNPVAQVSRSTSPIAQPKDLIFSNQTGTSVNVAFTKAEGSPVGYLVLRASGAAPSSSPVSGVAYAIGTAVGNAVVAYSGPTVSFFDAGLPTSTKYYYAIYSYNGSGGSISYLAASPLLGSTTLDVAPPFIAAASTNPVTIVSSSTPTFTATIIDNVGVASAQIFYKGISQKEFKSAPLNPLGNIYSVTVQTDWYDEMGMEYYFMASDGNGNTANRPNSSFAQLKAQILALPKLPTGTEQNGYRIVAFPYVMPTDNKVETIYGSAFNDNTEAVLLWWDPSLKNGTGEYLRYGHENGVQTLDPGKGYWVLSKSDIKPQLNDIPAPKYNSANLYTMTLKPKWNQIGNPYPVPISWDDVIAYNAVVNPGAIFSKLNVFDGAGYKTSSAMLNAYEGGFVKNMTSSDITIKIPFPAQTAGGRTAGIGSDISRDAWNIPLHIQQGGYVNRLGGFGMHPLSNAGQDRHDNFNPPRFMGVPEVNFVNHEVPAIAFSNDMVSTKDEYVWQFTPVGNPGEPAELSWDLPVAPGSQELFLFDEEQLVVVDMSRVSQYDFVLTPTSRFRVYFGRDVEEKITSENIESSSPYPNPLDADSRTTITLGLPDGNPYRVELQIFNMQGVQVESISRSLSPGIHSVEVELNDGAPPGMYLYRTSVSSDKLSRVFTGKIMKP